MHAAFACQTLQKIPTTKAIQHLACRKTRVRTRRLRSHWSTPAHMTFHLGQQLRRNASWFRKIVAVDLLGLKLPRM